MAIPIIRVENGIVMKVIYLRFRGGYVEFRKKSRSMYVKLLDFAIKNVIFALLHLWDLKWF